IMPKDIQL
nr:Chain E, ILE-MET-PRO-LYS-ASP-ILE-GLN-LEU [Homo sapiens]